jgi:hypothetical protein
MNAGRSPERVGTDRAVDIVIDNCNYGRFLRAAIDSAIAQTHPARVIVVDDGSTDDSKEVIQSYGNRVVAVLKENGGQASAFNAGLRRSSGDIVLLLDADDVLARRAAELAVRAFGADRSLVRLQYRMEVIDASGCPTGEVKPLAHVPLRRGDIRAETLAFPFDAAWMPTSATAISMPTVRRILPIPESEFARGADWYLIHLTGLLGRVEFIDEVGAYYRVHGGNAYEASREALDLNHVRQTIAYARRTARHLEALADELGLAYPPTGIDSVSELANRLVSLKLDPGRHPIPGDSLAAVAFAGLRATRRRFDVSMPMKGLFAAWFLSLTLAPRPLARRIAGVFLLPGRRRRLNRMIGKLHKRGQAS